MDRLASDCLIHAARAYHAWGDDHLWPLVLRLGVPRRDAAQHDDRVAENDGQGAADRRRLHEVAKVKILPPGRLAGGCAAWVESGRVVRSVFVLLPEHGHRALSHGE